MALILNSFAYLVSLTHTVIVTLTSQLIDASPRLLGAVFRWLFFVLSSQNADVFPHLIQ